MKRSISQILIKVEWLLFFTLLGVFIYSPLLEAKTYYVRSDGHDAASGENDTTDPVTGAWQTLSKVSSSSFQAGDYVKLRSGDKWREQLIWPSSGNPSSPITITRYGEGSAPIITGMTELDEIFLVPNGELDRHDFEDGTAGFMQSVGALIGTWGSLGVTPSGSGGSYGCRVHPDGLISHLSYTLDQPRSELWIEMEVRSCDSSLPAERMHLLTFVAPDGVGFASLRHEVGSKKLCVRNTVNNSIVQEATAPLDDTWYKLKVQLAMDPKDGSGAIRCWRDGVLVIGEEGSTITSFGYAKVAGFRVGYNNPATNTQPLYCDNVRWSRADFNRGVGLYTQGLPGAGVPHGRQILFVDSASYGEPVESISGLGEGQWHFDMETEHAYWVSELSGRRVELPHRGQVVSLNSKSHIIVDGLDISGCTNTAMGCSLVGAASATNCSGITIRNCVIHDTAYGGLSLTFNTSKVLVKDCTFHHCGHAGCFINFGSGVAIPHDILFLRNTIFQVWRQGITVEKGKDIRFYNNVIYDVHSDGTYGRGIELQTPTQGEVVICNNTVVDCEETCLFLGYDPEKFVFGLVKNNVVYATRGSGIWLSSGGSLWDLDCNLYWHSDPSGWILQRGDLSGYTRSQLLGIQRLGYEAHGISSDPQFVNLAERDLALLAVSPGIDAGNDEILNSFLTVDREGKRRVFDDPNIVNRLPASAVDIGAYEFKPAQYIYGDFDGDGDVDVDDWYDFAGCLRGANLFGPNESCSVSQFFQADADLDGDVDQEDFGVFQRCLGGESPDDPICSE